jgi:hypothetical protein
VSVIRLVAGGLVLRAFLFVDLMCYLFVSVNAVIMPSLLFRRLGRVGLQVIESVLRPLSLRAPQFHLPFK